MADRPHDRPLRFVASLLPGGQSFPPWPLPDAPGMQWSSAKLPILLEEEKERGAEEESDLMDEEKDV